jgi:ubiquinol-cytochrome c reductase subunit 7
VLTLRRADDLIPEESETVMLALKRLPPKEAYDRVFRMRRAFQVSIPLVLFIVCPNLTRKQCSLSHQLLPKEEQTKPEEVRPSPQKSMTV